ncbi:MAG: hypothetical protein ACOC1N_04265 [Bacillota bacterium]
MKKRLIKIIILYVVSIVLLVDSFLYDGSLSLKGLAIISFIFAILITVFYFSNKDK